MVSEKGVELKGVVGFVCQRFGDASGRER